MRWVPLLLQPSFTAWKGQVAVSLVWFVLVFVFTFSSETQAQDTQPAAHHEDAASRLERWWHGDRALGTWGGQRERAAEAGVGLDAHYVNNIAGNPVGGRRRGITYADNLHLGLRLDLERLVDWPGAVFTVSGLHRYGRSLSNEFVGNQYNVQQVFGGQTYMLYGLHLEQRLLHDRLSIKLGRYAASDDFNSAGVYGLYMNHGINGFVRNVQLNTQYSVYPFATWGLRVRADVSRLFNAQVGVFHNSDRVFDPTRHGADWRIRRGDGFLAVAQLAFTPSGIAAADAQADAAIRDQPTGHYWVGATASRFHYARFDGRGDERLSYGFYAHADQLVYREHGGRDEGLVLWAAGGFYPQHEIAIIPAQVNAGAIYRGLFPRRPHDLLITGLVYGSFGRSFARAFGDASSVPVAEPTRELVLELAYRLQLRGFFYVEPDLQWISRPGGTGTIDDALVMGLQSGLVF